ncbi:hypothetical protein BG015_009399 [Linnemannia schmuckeri]|uniref:Uncharacterized protein n=1 Tax=Linnemannia schmuckeri TaxID=64567 RepID=A0A9P5V9M6_9FUNG|nr:hypothetical protein BG015_009399 [Linnemannia schmuckeri]
MEDMFPVTYDEITATAIRRFLRVTSPVPSGDDCRFKSKAYNFVSGNVDCTYLAKDPSKWIGNLLDILKRVVLQADDSRLYCDCHLGPVALRQVFAIHQALGDKTVIEQVTVEYFRSPWSMRWNTRVRTALVEKTCTWYLSLPVETDARSEYEGPPIHRDSKNKRRRSISDYDSDDNPSVVSGNAFSALLAHSEQVHIVDPNAAMD